MRQSYTNTLLDAVDARREAPRRTACGITSDPEYKVFPPDRSSSYEPYPVP